MIARHILAGLWLLLWLTAAPGAHARVVASNGAAPALGSAAGHKHHSLHDLAGLHFRASRSSRRFDIQPITPDPLVGNGFFDAGCFQPNDLCGSRPGSEATLGLASGWQFLLRTALSPRAPSFVS